MSLLQSKHLYRCLVAISQPYLVILYARVEIVRPRVALLKLLNRLLDSFVGDDAILVDCLSADRASVDVVFIVVAISFLLLSLSFLCQCLKVGLDDGALKCLATLNKHGISHDISRDRTD